MFTLEPETVIVYLGASVPPANSLRNLMSVCAMQLMATQALPIQF